MSETLENTIIIGELKPLTKAQWKAAVVRKLQTFSISKEHAEVYAEELYRSYVDEKGFDFENFSVEKGFLCQDFSQDPLGAVMDDRAFWKQMTGATRYA